MAKSGGILSEEMFSIIIWALLYATIIAPIVFKTVLGNYVLKQAAANGEDVEAAKETVAEMQRNHTMNLHFADTIADAEKAEHESDHAKVAELEGKVAVQQEEILALQAQLFAVAPAGGPLPMLMGKTAAPPQNEEIKKEEIKKEEV